MERRNVYDEDWCNPLSMNPVIILPRPQLVLLIPHTQPLCIESKQHEVMWL